LNSNQNHSTKEISEKQIADIKTEIKETALRHLNSKSAISALSCYTKDATVISNGILYPSFESFAKDIKEFYSTLTKINLAAYDEMDINVITRDAALLTAKFRWSSTDIHGMTTNLQGVYSALYVCEDGEWKMSWRHESYLPMKN
jgi:ketosteroid isomerase-like protein